MNTLSKAQQAVVDAMKAGAELFYLRGIRNDNRWILSIKGKPSKTVNKQTIATLEKQKAIRVIHKPGLFSYPDYAELI